MSIPEIGVSTVPAQTSPALWRRLLRRPLATAALAFLILVIVASVGASWIAPYGPLDTDVSNILGGPTAAHPLGTDSLGRDVLSRLIYAGDSALGLVLVAIVVAVGIAVPVGLIVGLLRGWPDSVATRVGDLMLSIPAIIVLLMVLTLFNQNMVAAMAALGVLQAPGLMRVVRAAALAVSEEPYIAAARVAGLTRAQIARRHVLPRITGPILVNLSLIAAGSLLAETGLNFLGLGARPPTPSWGQMVADASASMEQQPWLLIPSGGVVALSTVAFVLLGDTIRDASTEQWAGGNDIVSQRGTRDSAAGGITASDPLDSTTADASWQHRDPIVRVETLHVAFPSRLRATGWLPVVQGVSFEIGRGETVGLVGESGCGKTLTGLALLDLLPAGGRIVSGTITVNGIDIATLRAKARRALRGREVAFVSQEPMVALDPMFTIGSQIGEAVRIHTKCSRRGAKARVQELLKQVQIPNPQQVGRLYPHQVSGGMAQRVSLAVALAGKPSLLIADEPTTALDVTVQAEILRLLKQVQQETGMALLLISHDWGVVAQTCERCVVMYAGQVVEYAPTAEILAQPHHPYSTGLLAADPHVAEPGRHLATIPGTVPPPAQWPQSCHFQSRCPYVIEECRSGVIPLRVHNSHHLTRCVRDNLPTRGDCSERRAPAGHT